jgi:P-type conjugative transfer protein TrbJ
MQLRLKYAATGIALLFTATNANALVCANCANIAQMAQSNIKQAMAYAEELTQTANQIKSLKNEAESISYQIQNLNPLDSSTWGDTAGQLTRLSSIASQGNAMAYSLVDLNSKWNSQFRGISKWASEVQTNDMVTEQYREWGDMMQSTAKSALQVANEMSAVQREDDNTMSTLQQKSSNSKGAMQVAQAGNEIAAQSVRQMQKMQTLLQTDMQMTATSISLAAEKEAQQKAATESTISDPSKISTKPDDGTDRTNIW